MKNRLFLGFAVAMMVLATSCGKLPQEKIDATNAAVEAAKTAQADVYMSTEFTALQDSLAAVMQAVDAENAKSMKKFDALTVKLDALTAQATEMAAAVPARKEAMKAEVESTLATAKAGIEATNTVLAKAAKAKATKAVAEEVSPEMVTITTTVTEVEASLAGDVNYAQVLEQLNAANQAIANINARLTEATTPAVK